MRPPALGPQEEAFPLSAGRGPAADESSRHDAGVVDDDEITGAEELRQVADVAVRDAAVGPPHDEQPRRRAVGERLLRDQLGRQMVVVRVGGVRVGGGHSRHGTVRLVE